MLKSLSRRSRLLIVASFVAPLILVVSTFAPAAWAAWMVRATGSGTAVIGSLSAEVDISEQLRPLTHSTLVDARLITITNTTEGSPSLPTAATVKVFTPEETPLSTESTLEVFPVASPQECSATTPTPSGAQQGKWQPGLSVTLDKVNPKQTATLCVKTSLSSWEKLASVDGKQTLTISVDVTLQLHNFTSTTSATSPLTSIGIYPRITLNSSYYQLKVVDSNNACLTIKPTSKGFLPGSTVDFTSCYHTSLLNTPGSYPQQFQLSTPSGTSTSHWLVPRSGPELSLFAIPTGPTSLVTFQTKGPAHNKFSGWFIEERPDKTIQLVSINSSRCFNASRTASDLVGECLDTGSQAFELRGGPSPRKPRSVDPHEPMLPLEHSDDLPVEEVPHEGEPQTETDDSPRDAPQSLAPSTAETPQQISQQWNYPGFTPSSGGGQPPLAITRGQQ